MQMTANLPDTPLVLEAVIEGFVQAAAAEIAAGVVPPYPELAGVKYVEEKTGQERWKLPHEVVADGQGDCEDLSFWEAAGMRVLGEDPAATVKLVKTGPKKLHAIVLRSDGSVSDPSARLKARQGTESRHKLVGSVGCVGCDDEALDMELGAAPRVIARNGVKPNGAPYRRPVRKDARPAPSASGTRTDLRTGEQLTEQSIRRLPPQAQDPYAMDPYSQSPYYPPGYLPPGMTPYQQWPPFDYYMSSPYAYGSPYDQSQAYGYSEDYWGEGSPYGFVWGDGPAVTYEDLYGPSMGPLMSPDPFGVSDDDVGEEPVE